MVRVWFLPFLVSGGMAETSLAAKGADAAGNIGMLQNQATRVAAGLWKAKKEQLYAFDDDMCSCRSRVELLTDWVAENCGGWGEASRCIARVVQDVQRIRPFTRVVDLVGANFTEQAVKTLKQEAMNHLTEQEGMLESLRHVISHLKGDKEASLGVTKSEVADRVLESQRFVKSPDRTVTLYVGRAAPEAAKVGETVHGLATDNMCTCFSVTKARVLWDEAPDALPSTSPRAAYVPAEIVWSDMPLVSPLRRMLKGALVNAEAGDGAELPKEQGRRLYNSKQQEEKELNEEGQLMVAGDKNFKHMVTLATSKYAKANKAKTQFCLICPAFWVWQEPFCDSGPLFPPYTIHCSGSYFVPSSNTYGAGMSFPYAISGIGYFGSCPYGWFTSCPGCLGYSPGWNICGQQWPERTCCSSHPSKSSNSDNGANNEFWEMYEKIKKTRRLAGSEENEEMYHHAGHEHLPSKTGDHTFLAPDGHVYDARLVEALFAFADQGVQLKAVTLFSTRLEQLKYLGWNPSGSSYQHMGVTVELSRPVRYEHLMVRFLTLEMMAPGLMWTVGATEAPTERYDYQRQRTFVYHELSPSVIARYLTGTRNQKYAWGTTDCQTFALELTQHLAMHGRRLQANSGSVHVDVMHSKRETGWEAQLTHHIKALLNRDANGVFEVKIGADEHECPGRASATGGMSEQANRVWSRCAVPLGIAPVEIRVSDDILGAVHQVLDILTDDEAFGEDTMMFLSVPRLSLDLEHGPSSYDEWKAQNKFQFDAHFLIIVTFTVVVLLVMIWLLIKLVTHCAGDKISARSPLRKTVMPATFAASLLTGTIAAPVAVGVFWHFKKKDSDESGGTPEKEVELSSEGEAMTVD